MTASTTFIFINSAIAAVRNVEQLLLKPDQSRDDTENEAWSSSSQPTFSQVSGSIFEMDDEPDEEDIAIRLLREPTVLSDTSLAQLVDDRDTCCDSSPLKVSSFVFLLISFCFIYIYIYIYLEYA
jgi:hypothetical protein